MKVIDLLNKIANGEELPKKIMYGNISYYWCEPCKIYERDEDTTRDLYNDIDNLNDEIEMKEESKKVEKLEPIYQIEKDINLDSVIAWQKVNNRIFQKKIDEIIDYINKGE